VRLVRGFLVTLSGDSSRQSSCACTILATPPQRNERSFLTGTGLVSHRFVTFNSISPPALPPWLPFNPAVCEPLPAIDCAQSQQHGLELAQGSVICEERGHTPRILGYGASNSTALHFFRILIGSKALAVVAERQCLLTWPLTSIPPPLPPPPPPQPCGMYASTNIHTA